LSDKIIVCRINKQNVGWDEFRTYDIKGSITGKYIFLK